MPEVQAKAIRARFADDTRKNESCRKEIEIAQFVSIAGIPEDGCARTALDIRTECVEREGRRAASDYAGHAQIGGLEFVSEFVYRRKRGIASRLTHCRIGSGNVYVVGVKTAG